MSSDFGGDTLTDADTPRLSSQLDAVRTIMSDGIGRTLAELAELVTQSIGKKATEASVSARLRDLRKPKFGGFKVDRESIGDGLFKYTVTRTQPARPIPQFNIARSQSGRMRVEADEIPATPVAGSTAAQRYLNSLQAG